MARISMRTRVRTRLTKNEQMQQLVRLYREETGESDVSPTRLAEYAVKKGWPLPKPSSPIEILARQFTEAMRVELKTDSTTGHPYRVNHAYIPGGQISLWFDIDDPYTTRSKMQISLINRREQMVGDGLQLTFDADHWNVAHPSEEPIKMPLDFTQDIAERKAAGG
jgi:hypothetical protein